MLHARLVTPSLAVVLVLTLAGAAHAQQLVAQPSSDAALTGQVRAELVRQMRADAGKIEVDVRNGVAYLSTTDRANAQMPRATIIAASVPGIMKVVKVDPAGGDAGKKGGDAAADKNRAEGGSDAALQRSAWRALVQRFGAEKASKMQVQVRSGGVSVRGLAGNQVGQAEVEAALRGLAGARGIEVSEMPGAPSRAPSAPQP